MVPSIAQRGVQKYAQPTGSNKKCAPYRNALKKWVPYLLLRNLILLWVWVKREHTFYQGIFPKATKHIRLRSIVIIAHLFVHVKIIVQIHRNLWILEWIYGQGLQECGMKPTASTKSKWLSIPSYFSSLRKLLTHWTISIFNSVFFKFLIPFFSNLLTTVAICAIIQLFLFHTKNN